MYIRSMRMWIKEIFYIPDVWISISLMFLLCILPVFTFGVAWGLSVYYACIHIRGDKIRYFPMFKIYIRRFLKKSFLMGILDILFLIAEILTFMTLTQSELSLLIKCFFVLFFSGNSIYLLSSIFRYPILINNEHLPIREIIYKGILITFSNLGNTLLIFSVCIAIVLISFATGIG